jgi:uroporphyrinogen decarboxylase
MMSEMTHWDRIRAAVRGEKTDHTPISLWRHWPTHEETVMGLTAVSIRWQQEYDWDMVKFTPRGTYGVEDWGARRAYVPNVGGVQSVAEPGLNQPDQWLQLPELDVASGCLGEQLAALQKTTETLQDQAPVLMTVFNPLTTAVKLAGNKVYTHLRLYPEKLHAGLEVITDTMIRFSLASLKAGAHGIFFATQSDSYQILNEQEYREFGETYDRKFLEALRKEAEFLMVHAHGYDIMFDLLATYPIDAINWHDRVAGPSLKSASERFKGMLVGGVDEWGTLQTGSAAEIQAELAEAVEQTGGRRLLLGPGCVIPITTPPEAIQAALEGIRA